MLKEALQKLIEEGHSPFSWSGLPAGKLRRFHRDINDWHRNDGKTYEQEEELDDEAELDDQESDDMVDLEWDEESDEGEDGDTQFDELDDEGDDPDHQGLIRVVPGAHLVYKRAEEDGTYQELWIYNTGQDFRDELEIRRAILAGTDIPPNKMKSPDGSQSFSLWNAGNAQLIQISGLPS